MLHLARELGGMTLEELLGRMSSAEIGLWRGLYHVENEEAKARETRAELKAEADQGIDNVRRKLRGGNRRSGSH